MASAAPDSPSHLLVAITCLLLLAAPSLHAQQPSHDSRYPAHWWIPIVDPKKPDWEILPQEAGAGEVILSKRNELGLLSNFAPTPFVFHGKHYASLEGFWQMMKYPEDNGDPRAKFPGLEWKYTRGQVAQMVSFEANRAGALASENMTKMGITWVSFEGQLLRIQARHRRRTLQTYRRGDLGESETESRSEKSPALNRRPNPQTRSSSGTERASRVALLRNPDGD